jgi:hypothetical protein
MSDIDFQNVCSCLGVPTPPRGYRAKLRHAHSVASRPLLAGHDGPKGHTFRLNRAEHRTVDPSDRHRSDPDSPSAGDHPLGLRPIIGAGRLSCLHPFAVIIRDHRGERDPDYRYSRVNSCGKHPAVRVFPGRRSRALRILRAIATASEVPGWTIDQGTGQRDTAYLEVGASRGGFRRLEQARRRGLSEDQSNGGPEQSIHVRGYRRASFGASPSHLSPMLEVVKGQREIDCRRPTPSFLRTTYDATVAKR